MNTPLRRLATVVLAMFVVLMAGTTWVQYVQADSLNNDPRNVRTLYREFGNARGPILVAGEAVASSAPVDDAFGYQRSYTGGDLWSTVTGYYSVVNGRSELELAANDALTGRGDQLFFTRARDLLTGRRPEGAAVETTLLPAAQQAARDGLGGQEGAVVAIEPSTGKILALVSTPGFDPNTLATHDTAAAGAAFSELDAAEGNPLRSNATRETYPPGSTFKLVTAAAALESGAYTPQTPLPAPVTLDLPQTTSTIGNFGGGGCGADPITLADALRVSCNTTFAQLGMDLGDDALRTQAERFGFNDPSLTIPMEVDASVFPEDLDAPTTAGSAIGQRDVRATPLQMAMVSAAIANGGQLMKPYVVQTVRSADLHTVDETEPELLSTAVSPGTAAALRDMMVGVVADGSGTAAQIPGVQVAGKTGTAQTGDDEAPHAWFTAFAPADAPRVAVAVIVEHGGSAGNEATGGRVAAPIAKSVIQAVLGS
ncbi:peptidoglycan D,D-transpeptidase FtsI family protein [Cellulomonas fimi]|uniref:Peptidoglycan glycosyltransferase n=1 Tax=Cellulomonas fimi (strain ATCC 484 / DSM 20113 / JCM 1341 / CCUG 24087 / LMG 16345 / NBRC 15513 / NCIMB 8980 / NCTC 7547 / NRS-133) TaxID=590998 RepID=F4H3V9_CELFA|nr:penicillin-binding protein 2 [Cellulomonas fimi]AEE44183.1 Peptidoglycan glycosyltransferase [Cellulomonas fimi ATCC 484]NNH07552.1 penicillin-binding protein 2 [Cellulomonas fimi]VEH25832.1 Penicillin-binding protein A [Cellulomonas fimi]